MEQIQNTYFKHFIMHCIQWNKRLFTLKVIAFHSDLFRDEQVAFHINIINIYSHCWQTDEQLGSNYCQD